MEQLVTIEIFGQPFTFKADSEISKAREVADLVEAEVNRVEAQQSGISVSVNKLAILISAALNIANAHIELKRNHGDVLYDISDRSARLIRILDESLG